MEWITSIKKSINYMEKHLLDEISMEDVAKHVNISSFYLQKGFQLITGVSMSEYIRKRRLYMAALDLMSGDDKIIEIAFKYGYETPESFTKAFTRFHGITPSGLKSEKTAIKTFLPIKISIVIQGGNEMDYVVEKMKGFKVIGYEREFTFDNGYDNIPKFWCEIFKEKVEPIFQKEKPETEEEEAISNCKIGEFGICIDDIGEYGKFRYMIAGIYTEGKVPDGMVVYEIPELEWAKFKCVGPNPGAIQSVNTKIFKEWLPGNDSYEIAMGLNLEWYSQKGNQTDSDYESSIWLPVKRK